MDVPVCHPGPSSSYLREPRPLLRSSLVEGDFYCLSDEIILMILKCLSCQDLYPLLRTCRRLHRLCQEEILWTSVVDTQDRHEDLNFALCRLLNQKTEKVKVASGSHPANRGFRSSLRPSLVNVLLNQNTLKELQLLNQSLDGRHFSMHKLPKSLRILNMTGSIIHNNTTERVPYWKDLYMKLPNLEDLTLTNCSFVTAHSLMSISKFPKLQRLVLRGCRKIGECLAYVALSSRFGFKNLKVLDVTDTKVGSSEFTSFASIATLEEFYLGQYDAFVEHACNLITDLCLTRLRNSPCLRLLDISGSRITDRTLEVFASIPKLTGVQAHFTQLSDAGVSAFHATRPHCRITKTENPVEVPLPPTVPLHQIGVHDIVEEFEGGAQVFLVNEGGIFNVNLQNFA